MKNEVYAPINQPFISTAPAEANSLDAFLGNATGLTPEALLFYCQTQLGSIDDDIRTFMEKQKSMQAKKKILQDLKTTFETNSTVDKNGDDLDNRVDKILEAYKTAYEALKEIDPDAAAKLAQEFKKSFPNGDLATQNYNTSGHNLTADVESTFKDKFSYLESMIDDLGKNAELNMIQLQSIMSQRQTAIQLTTNILDKYNKGIDSIVANMK